jgi:hypothetical protein
MSFVKIDGQPVELLPAHIVLSLFRGCSCGGKGGEDGSVRGGNGGVTAGGGVGRGGLGSTS